MTRTNDAMTVTLSESDGEPTIVKASHAGGVDSGQIPFNPTGDWIFTSNDPRDDETCTTLISADALTNTCNGFKHLYALDLDSFDGTVTAHRTQRGSSIFGEFGGSWTVQIGNTGTCNVSFIASTFTATCSKAGVFTGSASGTVMGDMASGKIGRSEFSAQRQ